MATGSRVPLAQALALAEELRDLLAPACQQIEIAGSIRRQRPDVGDIELLHIPLWQPRLDLFGERNEPASQTVLLVEELIRSGELAERLDVHGRGAMGVKYMRLAFRGFPLDLFGANVDNWGLMLAIRTGPAGWSKRLVTARRLGGWMPANLHVKDGFLWQDAGDRGQPGLKVAVPSEAVLFALLGQPFEQPEARRD